MFILFDYTDRGTAEYHGRDASGDTGEGRETDVLSGAGRTIAAILRCNLHHKESVSAHRNIHVLHIRFLGLAVFP